MNHHLETARRWVYGTYGDSVVITSDEPIIQTSFVSVFHCQRRHATAHDAHTNPMLNSSVAVRDGLATAFHLSNSDPFGDIEALEDNPGAAQLDERARMTNAQHTAVAMHDAVNGIPWPAALWSPGDETSDWWQAVRDNAPAPAEEAAFDTWDALIARMLSEPLGTRAFVWVQRQVNGVPVTGNVLYVMHTEDGVVLLDGQRESLAQLDTVERLQQLRCILFHQPMVGPDDGAASERAGWNQSAGALDEAIAKARAWIERAYGLDVVLVDPSEDDRINRGWLFAINTRRYVETGLALHCMLDAGLIVPSDGMHAPFLIHNKDPWGWLHQWDAVGAEIDGTTMPACPEPTSTSWAPDTFGDLDAAQHRLANMRSYSSWQDARADLARSGGQHVLWVRRKDRAHRESTGWLLVTQPSPGAVGLMDPMTQSEVPPPRDFYELCVVPIA